MEKEFFDINSLPKDPVTVIFNKPNMRQFVVVKYYHKDLHITKEHVFTSDSFKEAIKVAYKSISENCYIEMNVYEADGKKIICNWIQSDIRDLYKIREYLK